MTMLATSMPKLIYAPVPDLLIDQCRRSHAFKSVVLALVRFAREGRRRGGSGFECRPSNREICAAAGVGTSTVIACLRTLEDEAMIEREYDPWPGVGRTIRFLFRFPLGLAEGSENPVSGPTTNGKGARAEQLGGARSATRGRALGNGGARAEQLALPITGELIPKEDREETSPVTPTPLLAAPDGTGRDVASIPSIPDPAPSSDPDPFDGSDPGPEPLSAPAPAQAEAEARELAEAIAEAEALAQSRDPVLARIGRTSLALIARDGHAAIHPPPPREVAPPPPSLHAGTSETPRASPAPVAATGRDESVPLAPILARVRSGADRDDPAPVVSALMRRWREGDNPTTRDCFAAAVRRLAPGELEGLVRDADRRDVRCPGRRFSRQACLALKALARGGPS